MKEIPDAVLAFLLTWGCVPSADLQWMPTLSKPAIQVGRHILIRTEDPGVLVHELWHDCQWQKNGGKPAADYEQWLKWENEASSIEAIYRKSEM